MNWTQGLSVASPVSDRHANFFVNAGHASGHGHAEADPDVRERVQKNYGRRTGE